MNFCDLPLLNFCDLPLPASTCATIEWVESFQNYLGQFIRTQE
jgi:hypothetical protein